MKFYIETERLILRDVLLTDQEAWFEMDSHPEVHRYLGNNPLKSMDEVPAIIKMVQQQYTDNGIGRWATIEKSSRKFIGWSGLKLIKEYENNHINYYDVGYRLHPDYWGKGYATEACKASLKYGFTQLKLKEIIGTVNEKNEASKRVLAKCGLKFIEKFMWCDIPCDWMMITHDEWKQIQ